MNMILQPIIKDVLGLRAYTPGDEVNRVMESLVQGVVDTESEPTQPVATPNQAVKVREVCAETESELEKFWARRVIQSNNPAETLRSFPYLDNYVELTRREVELIKHSGLQLNSTHKVLIIGSGPLPLSAYELHRQTGAHVDHVDSSPEAIHLCSQVMKQLNASSKYYEASGESVVLGDTYDLVLIAALAGNTADEKQRIIDTILPHLAKKGRIAVRSARGSRTLLYPGIESTEIKGVKLLEEYHPSDYIINSVFIYGA